MRTIAIEDFGAAPALLNVPIPTPESGEVLVRVHSSSLNGFDLSVASGRLKGMMEHRFPVVLGKDFAGTVESVGADVSRFKVGDRVFGVLMKPVLGDGTFGEFVTVPESFGITHIPSELSFQAAGALGLAGSAALMAVDAVAPVAGKSVLVAGATGGVGAFAVQLAAARGAQVIATAKRGEETAFVRRMGATLTVDYSDDVASAVRSLYPNGVDALIHLAGDGVQLSDLLASGGRMASTLGLSPDHLGDRPVALTRIMATPDQARLNSLAADVASGVLQVPIHATYRLEDVPQAIADFRTGTLGKLAVTLE